MANLTPSSAPLKVVLDTNIVISACWKPDGLESRTLALAIDGLIQPCVTPEVWAEYRDVVCRDKFARIRDRATVLLHALEHRVTLVHAFARLTVATDEDDNRFLECAAAAQARYLVTGNRKHFPPTWGSTTILNARDFLNESSAWSDISSAARK